MKKIALLALSILLGVGTSFELSAQAEQPVPKVSVPKPIKPRPKRQDQVIFTFHSSQVLRNEGQGVKNKWYSHGFSGALMYDFIIKRSNFSFGIGAGASNDNFYLDKKITYDPTTQGTVFTAFPDTFKRYKFSTTTLEIPLELRFRVHPHKRNTFKIAVGANIGYMVGARTKYVGDGVNYEGVEIDKAKIKEFNPPGINRLVYGVHMRLGYGRFAITGHYALSELWKANKGPKGWHPINIGITITPF